MIRMGLRGSRFLFPWLRQLLMLVPRVAAARIRRVHARLYQPRHQRVNANRLGNHALNAGMCCRSFCHQGRDVFLQWPGTKGVATIRCLLARQPRAPLAGGTPQQLPPDNRDVLLQPSA